VFCWVRCWHLGSFAWRLQEGNFSTDLPKIGQHGCGPSRWKCPPRQACNEARLRNYPSGHLGPSRRCRARTTRYSDQPSPFSTIANLHKEYTTMGSSKDSVILPAPAGTPPCLPRDGEDDEVIGAPASARHRHGISLLRQGASTPDRTIIAVTESLSASESDGSNVVGAGMRGSSNPLSASASPRNEFLEHRKQLHSRGLFVCKGGGCAYRFCL